MAQQVLHQFRWDKQLREDCVAIYSVSGMDRNTAFRMFMERTRAVRGLPFPAVLPERTISSREALEVFQKMREETADLPEMTLDEINEEIRQARAARKARAE